MQNAATVLNVIRHRGQQGLPLQRLYRQLVNPDLYRRAYARLYRNDGALTPGTTSETVDGMSQAKIDAIIEAVRFERYRWTPARRVFIGKRHSTKKRPLGLPSWSDKLLQEVVRSLLDAYYEPQFSRHSHGFRAGRGCHTALTAIHETWKGSTWLIEGDISACFDSLNHDVLLAILAEKIHDRRFLRLVAHLLQAGYLEDWRYHRTLSGSPQGAVVSPILSNVYLDRLDQFVETMLLPQYNRGAKRKPNPAYVRLQDRTYHLERAGRRREARPLRQQQWRLPASDPQDPAFRRLHYVRYADDVRHITRCAIPFAERRGSEEQAPGSTAYPAAKAKRDRSMPLKREGPGDAHGCDPQDPRDMVRTTLFEPQSPAMQAYIPRLQRLLRGHDDGAMKSSSPEPSASWAIGNDPIQGDGHGAYVALDTSHTEGMWDRPPRREAQGDGASIVVRGRESRPHGEGRQVFRCQGRRGTRDACD